MKVSNLSLFEQMPDVIFFDLDNTLYDYTPCHRLAEDTVEKKIISTLSISPKNFIKGYSQAKKEIKSQLDKTASSHSRLLYFHRTLEIMGLGSQALLALDLEQTYWRTFLSNATLFDNVIELLDELKIIDTLLVIVTDLTAQIQLRKLIYFELDKYFYYIVTSEEAGFDKPQDSIFKLALKKINYHPKCLWMIGDDPIKDIQGAKNAVNAVCIQKLHSGVQKGSGASLPDASFNNYSELRRFIAKLSKKHEKK